MSLRVCLTFDVEQDCPPYLTSFSGVRIALPLLLDFLDERNIKATFFFTGMVAKKFPELVKRAVDEGHEVASHSFNHERLDMLNKDRAGRLITKSIEILKRFYDVVSFRAPNLKLPNHLFPVLKNTGIHIDSSMALYKGWSRGICNMSGVIEVPVSITSSVLRIPWKCQRIIHSTLTRITSPIVYFYHPWEFIEMKNSGIRPDCRFNTGNKAFELMERLVSYHLRKKARFLTIKDYVDLIGVR